MKFLCLGYLNAEQFDNLPEDQKNALLAQCMQQCLRFRESGQVIDEQSLDHFRQAKSIRPKDGKPSVTDGPFLEVKELLGSYFVVEADDIEAAVAVASLHPAAQFGEEHGFGIEVWPIPTTRTAEKTPTSEAKSLRRACAIFTQDLEALPESAFTQKFGPKTRAVADIVHEVNLVNDHIGQALRGEPQFEWPTEGWIVAPPEMNNKSAVLEAWQISSTRILEIAESYSAQDLLGKVLTEQSETQRGERLRFMTLHIWYHSGQLNFIQTLLGDDGWHWN